MIDLTIKLGEEHRVWNWLTAQDHKLINAGHIGTHIDVYEKSNIPIEYFETTGLLIDCSDYKPDEEIGLEILKNICIPQNSFVIFKTEIQNKSPYGSNKYINEHHELSWELIDYLLDRKVRFIGIDCAGIRRGKEHFLADIKAENNLTFIVENLDLTALTTNNFTVYTMWIDNPFSTGLSARVLVKS